MVKAIKFICIVGILALLVLFVIFTGDGRSASKKTFDKRVYKEQSIQPHKSNTQSKSKINIDSEPDVLNFVIRW